MGNETVREWIGLCRLADCVVPASAGLPAFRDVVRTANVRAVIEALPPNDAKDLRMIFRVFSRLPTLVVGILLFWIRRLSPLPIWPGKIFRLLDIGLRGFVFTLYFSERPILEALNWDAAVRVPAGKAK